MACKKCGGKGCNSCQKSGSSSAKPSSNRVSALKHSESSGKSGSSGKTSSSSKSSSGSGLLYLSKRDNPKAKESSSSAKPSSSKPKESTNQASSTKPKESPSKPSSSKQPSSSKKDSSSGASGSSTFKSAFKSDHDKKMASRQTKIETLSREERRKQEEWAQKQLQNPELSPCPGGLDWTRHTGGYMCTSGLHFIPDALLAEGKGGYYIRSFGDMFGSSSILLNNLASALAPSRSEKDLRTTTVDGAGGYKGSIYPTPDQIALSKRLKEFRENGAVGAGSLRDLLGRGQGPSGFGGPGPGGNGFGGGGYGR